MPRYTIKFDKDERSAYVLGLQSTTWDIDKDEDVPVADTWIHFGHLVLTTTDSYPVQQVPPYHKYYGGMGEGSSFNTWHGALLVSLYDLFQTHDKLHDGDTFTATYNGETKTYACDGVHVVYLESRSICAKCGNNAVGDKSLCCEAHVVQPSDYADMKADREAKY